MNDYQKIVESDIQTFIDNYDTRPVDLNTKKVEDIFSTAAPEILKKSKKILLDVKFCVLSFPGVKMDF